MPSKREIQKAEALVAQKEMELQQAINIRDDIIGKRQAEISKFKYRLGTVALIAGEIGLTVGFGLIDTTIYAQSSDHYIHQICNTLYPIGLIGIPAVTGFIRWYKSP